VVNTIILSEKWSILFFFISKMMNIFIWSPNLNFYSGAVLTAQPWYNIHIFRDLQSEPIR
jgi:hypothetical protein